MKKKASVKQLQARAKFAKAVNMQLVLKAKPEQKQFVVI